jgi:hypothetical protein
MTRLFPKTLVALLAIAAVAIVGAIVLLGPRSAGRASGPLRQEAYVWQRVWTPEVKDAVSGSRGLAGLTVLASQVDLSRQPPRIARAHYDAAALQATGRPVGLAIRIGRFAGGAGRFEADPGQVHFLTSVARQVVDEAKKRGLNPAELQIDFDCPESRLGDYPELLAAIKATVAPVRVVFTALPSWLSHDREFRRIAEAADGYVLQVHSFSAPRDPDAPLVVCDPEDARDWVDEAARFGKPFRVALPTYGYVAAFDPQGKLLGVSAEGPSLAWPPDVKLRVAASDPYAMVGLVRGWTRSRPRELAGIVWYRLPSSRDSLNWAPSTFAAVVAGRDPKRDLRIEPQSVRPTYFQIALVNAGEADAPWPASFRVRWTGGSLISADGLAGYERPRILPDEATFLRTAPASADLPDLPLRPGERRIAAWLRFDRETKVTADVPTSP